VEQTISRQIAEYAVNLRYEDLPENVVQEVKRYLYDSVGCALGSMHTRDVNIIKDIYADMGGKKKLQYSAINLRCRLCKPVS